MSQPADEFVSYWSRLDSERGMCAAVPVLEPLRTHSAKEFSVYGLRLTSLGGYRIFGYLSIPNSSEGPFAAVLETPSYGSVNNPPDWTDRLRYVVLTIMHRGQRLADEPFAASYPGLLTLNIHDSEKYIYRGIVADCLTAADFLFGLPEVDVARVSIVGNELALLTAARHPGFAAIRFVTGIFYRSLEARLLSDSYPLEELNDYLREHPSSYEAMAATLSLFDPINHASTVDAWCLIGVGHTGGLDGRPWLDPLLSALAGEVEEYCLTYRGAVDRDNLDRKMSARLGVQPIPRFCATLR